MVVKLLNEKCGYVAILGATNAGKSTLLNAITGAHSAIVSHKVQTTRFQIRGARNVGDTQVVFIDTPGVFDAKGAFDRRMVSEAWTAMDSADAVLYLLDAKKGMTATFARIVDKLRTLGKPIALALNKIDLVRKDSLLELTAKITAAAPDLFDEVFMVSAAKNDGIDRLLNWAATKMPAAKWLFSAPTPSDLPLEVQLAELTREQVYRYLHHELPYMIKVETDSVETRGNLALIGQTIYTSDPTHRQIIIGARGGKLKEIGTSARMSIEAALGKKVNLDLRVDVDKNWKS
ncbi:MAG: GTPase Era [Rickettsiales bacterium]|jgi:GTP-binding protein Era|nr:GTPase Era [Rickettsiales bacterium]